jgi:NADP-dependent 3-hydroxy acid dehydrogenase YdfG
MSQPATDRLPGLPTAPSVFRENAVILAGATSGIGRAMAQQLAAAGVWLALAAAS